jgi:hypothetical protein
MTKKRKINPVKKAVTALSEYPYYLITSFLHPFQFIKKVKEEKSLTKAVIFFLLNILISALIRTITKIFYFKSGLLFLTAISATAVMLPLLFIMVVGVTLFFHLIAKLLNGQASFSKSLIGVCLSTMPLLFSQLPFVGVISILYCLVLLSLIFDKIQQLTFTKTIIITVVPFVFIFIVFALLGFVNYGLIIRVFNLG